MQDRTKDLLKYRDFYQKKIKLSEYHIKNINKVKKYVHSKADINFGYFFCVIALISCWICLWGGLSIENLLAKIVMIVFSGGSGLFSAYNLCTTTSKVFENKKETQKFRDFKLETYNRVLNMSKEKIEELDREIFCIQNNNTSYDSSNRAPKIQLESLENVTIEGTREQLKKERLKLSFCLLYSVKRCILCQA